KPLGDILNQLARRQQFILGRPVHMALLVKQHQLGVVGVHGALGQVGNQQRHIFTLALGLGVLDQVVGFSGKAYAERTVLQCSNLGQNVGVGAELQVWRGLFGGLFDF